MMCSAQEPVICLFTKRQCSCHGFTSLHYVCTNLDYSALSLMLSQRAMNPLALTLKCHKGFTPIDLLIFRFNHDDKIGLVVGLMKLFPGREFELPSSKVGFTLASRLVHSMLSAPNLKSLHISRAQMSRRGLKTLLSDLRDNTTLKEIEFRWIEEIDDDMADAFQQVWKHNTTLTKVTILSRFLSQEDKEVVQRALSIGDNTSLTQLRVDIIPEYKLRLLMSSLYDLTDHDRIHQINRTELDMKLALNCALQSTHLGSLDHHSIPEFTTMLEQANTSLSAQYILLRSVPHVWSHA